MLVSMFMFCPFITDDLMGIRANSIIFLIDKVELNCIFVHTTEKLLVVSFFLAYLFWSLY